MKKQIVKTFSFVLVFVLSMLALSSCSASNDSLIKINMSKLNPWLNNESSEVVKIEEIHTYYGIAPNTRVASYYTEDTEVIKQYIDWLGNSKLSVAIPPIGINGGGSTRHVFTFADGTTKEIYTQHGFYYSGLLCFEMHSQRFLGKDDMDVFCRFNASKNNYSIYTCGETPELVKEVEKGVDELCFVRLTDVEEPETEPTNYLDTSFGKVYIYSDTLCYIDTGDEDIDANNGYYELYGATFAELMK